MAFLAAPGNRPTFLAACWISRICAFGFVHIKSDPPIVINPATCCQCPAFRTEFRLAVHKVLCFRLVFVIVFFFISASRSSSENQYTQCTYCGDFLNTLIIAQSPYICLYRDSSMLFSNWQVGPSSRWVGLAGRSRFTHGLIAKELLQADNQYKWNSALPCYWLSVSNRHAARQKPVKTHPKKACRCLISLFKIGFRRITKTIANNTQIPKLWEIRNHVRWQAFLPVIIVQLSI